MVHTLNESVPHQRIPNHIESHLIFGVLKISTKVYFPSVASSCEDSSSVWKMGKRAKCHMNPKIAVIVVFNCRTIQNAPQAWCLPCTQLCCSSLHISWCTDGRLLPSRWLRATVQTLAASWCKKESKLSGTVQWWLITCVSVRLKKKVKYRHAMTESSSGEVTARISILHSLTKYAIAGKIQLPRDTSRLMIMPANVLRSMLTHSTSGTSWETFYLKETNSLFREGWKTKDAGWCWWLSMINI